MSIPFLKKIKKIFPVDNVCSLAYNKREDIIPQKTLDKSDFIGYNSIREKSQMFVVTRYTTNKRSGSNVCRYPICD